MAYTYKERLKFQTTAPFNNIFKNDIATLVFILKTGAKLCKTVL